MFEVFLKVEIKQLFELDGRRELDGRGIGEGNRVIFQNWKVMFLLFVFWCVSIVQFFVVGKIQNVVDFILELGYVL